MGVYRVQPQNEVNPSGAADFGETETLPVLSDHSGVFASLVEAIHGMSPQSMNYLMILDVLFIFLGRYMDCL